MRTRVVVIFCLLLLCPTLLYAQWQDDGVAVCAASANQQSPAAVSDGVGGAFMVWADTRNGVSDIYAQRIDAGGHALWTTDGVAVCTQSADQSFPTLLADGTGGVIIAWHDWRNNVAAGQDLYTQRLNASGVPQWTANGVVLVSATAGQHYPRLVSNGAGGALAVWLDFRNGSMNSDIYGTRLTSTGTLPDGIGGFAVSTAAQDQTPSSIIPYAGGGAIVAWTDTRNGNPNIYAARSSNAGVVLDAIGIPLCVVGGDQLYPNTISDGAGGAIFAWSDAAQAGEIFAQRINSAGVVQWTANGVMVGTNLLASILQAPQMVADGAGGAILSWFRYDLSELNIYAQRIDGSGAKQWLAAGVPVCTAASDQSYLVMTSDQAGGAVVGWADARNATGGNDVFAQRVLANGTMAWAINGVVLCDLSFDQSELAVVSDLTGGAIFAWTDKRNFTHTDIYAQRLASAGQMPTGVGDAPAAASLGMNYPNPFNPETSIPFSLANAGHVTLRVYDVSGRFVTTLLDENRGAGEHVARWDGRDARGRASSSGIYFVRLNASGRTETKKIALLK
jgi:hypothetical protein